MRGAKNQVFPAFMKKHGFDPDEIRYIVGLEDADDRRAGWASYREWIVEGSKASNGYEFGAVPLGLGVFIPSLLAIKGVFFWWLLVLSVLLIVPGAYCVWKAERLEREWREANPFKAKRDNT